MSILHLILRVSSGEQAKDEEKGFDVQLDNEVCFVDTIGKYDNYERVVYPFTQSSTEPKFLRDRPDLLHILEIIKPDDVPCFFNTERLSREDFVGREFIQYLRYEKGVKEIIISNKVYDLTNETELMVQKVCLAMTHKQSNEDVLRRTEAKRRHRDEGKYIGGMFALGYDKNRKQDKHRDFIIEPKGAMIYKRIVNEYLEGSSTSDIAIMLNKEGILTPRVMAGNEFKKIRIRKWRSETIRYILRNPFYQGKIRTGDGRLVDGRHPPLIKEEEWNKVQQKLRNSASRPGIQNVKKTLLLRDLLWCNRCENRLLGRTTFVKRRRKPDHWIKQYYCSNRWIEKEYKDECKYCDSKLIDMDVLDNLVWNRTVMYLLNVDELKKELQKPQDQNETQKIKGKILSLQADIKCFKAGHRELLNMVGYGSWTKEEVLSKARELESRISEAEAEISVLQDSLLGEEKLNNTLLTLKEVSQQLKRNLYNYTPEKKRELLLKVIKEIRIDWIVKDVYIETSRDCLSVDIKYVLDIKELRNYIGIKDASLRLCLTLPWKKRWKYPRFIR